MSSFFEPPPPPPEPPPPPPRPSLPAWFGPPDAVVGSAVALNLVIGRSDKAAIWISAVTVYPEGFVFDIEIRHRLGRHLIDPLDFRGSRPRTEELDPELLRIGIAFSDGRKATTLGPGRPHPYTMREAPDAEPEGPILSVSGGSGGGGGHWQQGFWVWPLPPEGPLAFVCEWPAAGIPETRNEIDSALVRDAASDAFPLWSDTETLGESGEGASYETHQVMLRAEPSSEPENQAD
jgi:hypothetical protein